MKRKRLNSSILTLLIGGALAWMATMMNGCAVLAGAAAGGAAGYAAGHEAGEEEAEEEIDAHHHD